MCMSKSNDIIIKSIGDQENEIAYNTCERRMYMLRERNERMEKRESCCCMCYKMCR